MMGPLGWRGGHLFESNSAVRRLLDAPALALEHPAQHLAGGRVVLHDERSPFADTVVDRSVARDVLAERGEESLIAGDIIEAIPAAMAPARSHCSATADCAIVTHRRSAWPASRCSARRTRPPREGNGAWQRPQV